MSDVGQTYEQITAAQEEQRARARFLQDAYHAVFFGAPKAEQQRAVWADLEAFCGMRTSLLRERFEETAHAVGSFRVFQRLNAFCFPRPADATPSPGESHGRARPERPIAGGGVAERTVD